MSIKEFEKTAKIACKERVTEALKKFTKEQVIKGLEQQKLNYQLMQMISTKGCIMGTPDFDKLQICINTLDKEINHLKEEIQTEDIARKEELENMGGP